MSKWECIVCAWVYDEAVGDPDSGIAPGTKFEDIPDDWLCPDCGVGKEDFELLEQQPIAEEGHQKQHTTEKNSAPIVILGTGMAGYGLAAELRKIDKETPLILISSDDGRSYSKPMLSTGYTKGSTASDLVSSDAGTMGKQLNASVWTMTTVTAIDTAKQLISLDDTKTSIHYSKLILATGADTILPPIEGNGLDCVYRVNNLMDYDEFRTTVETNGVNKVVIIGGGLIGCEFANDLLNGGLEVEVVDPLAYCLPTLLPEVAGTAVQQALENMGAKFHFGLLVTEVNKKADGSLAVSLNDGRVLDADLVVSAVGVRPRTALAKAADIDVNRGIATNRLLETSAPNVYALGDCAEVNGHVLLYVAPLMTCARALAKTLTGNPTEVCYPAMPVTIKTPACPVVVSPVAADAEGAWDVEAEGHNVVAQFRNRLGELLGFALTGDGTKEKMRLQKELPPIMG